MLVHKRIISMSATPIKLKLKKIKLQAKFRIIWIENTLIAKSLTFDASSFQIRKNEIPRSMYKEVHTGPKTQLGGLKEGLFNDAYHVGTACEVNIPAIAPTDRGNNNDTASLIMFDLLILNTSLFFKLF